MAEVRAAPGQAEHDDQMVSVLHVRKIDEAIGIGTEGLLTKDPGDDA